MPAPRGRGARRGGRGGRGGLRTDRDGDVQMGAAPELSSKPSRGGIRKSGGAPNRGRDSQQPPRGRDSGRRGRDGKRSNFNTDILKKHLNLDDDDSEAKSRKHINIIAQKSSDSSSFTRGKDVLLVQGVKNSQATNNDDKGLAALVKFLQGKASRGGSNVRLGNHWMEGDNEVYIEANPKDTPSILRLNGYTFAQAPIEITMHKKSGETSTQAKQIAGVLEGFLDKRYNLETKTLDLSAIGDDPLFANMDEKTRNDVLKGQNLFPALLSLASQRFKSGAEKRDAIMNISFAQNSLSDLRSIRDVSTTFPLIQGLDLSNNLISNVEVFSVWRRKLKALSLLYVTNNPFSTDLAKPSWREELIKWFPALLTLNGEQVRSEAEAAANSALRSVDFRIAPSFISDASGSVVQFVRHLIQGFDNNRQGLLEAYYDERSVFMVSAMSTRQGAQDQFIRRSRNQMKVTTPTTRLDRMYTGASAIYPVWQTLPNTRHPDLDQEADQWFIESQMVAGSDIGGQAPLGVNGYTINLHSKFGEIDADNKITFVRSFDRNLVVGPGPGPAGVRVISDILTIRDEVDALSWAAIQPGQATAEAPAAVPSQPMPAPNLQPAAPVPAPGPVAQPTSEFTQEYLLSEFMKHTKLTQQYALMCLETVAWEPQAAMARFEEVKPTLGPDAFTA